MLETDGPSSALMERMQSTCPGADVSAWRTDEAGAPTREGGRPPQAGREGGQARVAPGDPMAVAVNAGGTPAAPNPSRAQGVLLTLLEGNSPDRTYRNLAISTVWQSN
ncbi:hypothetical protein Taro_045088, partial [Colocasia esculenta]|nr:hypothetical protein [Colocasia esculenta]